LGLATGKPVSAADLPKFLDIESAAQVPACSPATIRRLLTQGRLTRYKFGGRTLISAAELLAMIVPVDPAQTRARWEEAREGGE
jgi:excisionase family DNA binding protein